MALELASEPREFEIVQREDAFVANKYHAVRIAHRDRCDALDAACDFQRIIDNAAVVRDWNLPAVEDRLAHIYRGGDIVTVDFDGDRLVPAIGLDRDRILPAAGNFVIKARDAADTVAAHFAAAAVSVVHLHPHISHGRGTEHDQAI